MRAIDNGHGRFLGLQALVAWDGDRVKRLFARRGRFLSRQATRTTPISLGMEEIAGMGSPSTEGREGISPYPIAIYLFPIPLKGEEKYKYNARYEKDIIGCYM